MSYVLLHFERRRDFIEFISHNMLEYTVECQKLLESAMKEKELKIYHPETARFSMM